MKNIKLLLILFIQISLVQLAVSQKPVETDENGRAIGATPAAVAKKAEGAATLDVFKGHDKDLEGVEHETPASELEGEMAPTRDRDEYIESHDDILAKIATMEAELATLRQYNEQLELENSTIRRGMTNCCMESKPDLSIANSFLLQNAPNPFHESTKVQFFIPEKVETATLQIRNIKGQLLDAYDLDEGGLGEVEIEGNLLEQGTYIYTLVIDGKMVDSKMMILTK